MKETYLTAMDIVLVMDRKADPDRHYIVPGGYELNHKQFDFTFSEWEPRRDPDDDGKTIIAHAEDYDYYFTQAPITKEDTLGEFQEFPIYTGEHTDPEISPVRVAEIIFYWDDHTKSSANKELLSSANKVLSRTGS